MIQIKRECCQSSMHISCTVVRTYLNANIKFWMIEVVGMPTQIHKKNKF
jgi:hypothetical protein